MRNLTGVTILLAALATGACAGSASAPVKIETAKIQIDALGAAVDSFQIDNGRYPSTDESLKALVEKPATLESWDGPYIKKKESLLDPWGEPYKYRCCPGQHGDYDIWSEGADKAPGGEGENADVLSWDAEQR